MSLHNDVDLRSFSYALAPVQRQAEWRLERLQRDLGAAAKRVSDGEARLAQMRAVHASHSDELAKEWQRRTDPAGHARGLAFLGQSGARIRAQAQRVAVDREHLLEVQQACLQAQSRVQGMERHEQEAIAVFAAEQRRREAVEADRNWAARGAVRQIAPSSNDRGAA